MSIETGSMNEILQPGELLKIEREKRGVTTKQLATVLNLPERFIIHLEAGEFNQLPGTTFTRGYIRNYGKYLELENINDIVELFDHYTAGDTKEGRVLDFKQIKRIKSISNSIYWLASFIIFLVLIGVVFLVWQYFLSSNDTSSKMVSGSDSVMLEPQQNITDNPEAPHSNMMIDNNNIAFSLPLQKGENENIQEQPLNLSLSNVNGSEGDANTNLVEKTAAGSMHTPGGISSEKGRVKEGMGRVQASFKSSCWVTITDGGGKVLVNKLFVANTSLDIIGKPPLDMLLGAPNAASVTYNGVAVKIEAKSGASHRIKLGK